MKKVFGIAALLLALAACNKVETEITPVEQPSDSKGITITATLAPKTADTKAVADGGDKITVTWAENEHIAILYTVGSTKKVADAEITAVDGSGAATITFTVDGGTPDNTDCTLVYPYTAAKDDHTGVKDASTLLAAQDGTLNANLDVRVGAGTIRTTTPGLDVTTQPAAQFAIFKFTVKNADASATIDVKPLIITIGTQDYTITPASATSTLYAALPAVSSQTVSFSATGSDSKTYTCSKDGVTFAAAKYYQSTLKMAEAAPAYKLLSAATAEDYGKVVCEAGHLHDARTAVPAGCTAVGILGEVTETGCGLILALNDATSQTWNTINGWTPTTDFAGGTTLKVLPDDAARGANLTSYTLLGTTVVSDWAVAQKSDYEEIFTNLGSTKYDDGYTYDANVNAYITTGVGGTALSGHYWSATKNNIVDLAYCFGSDIGWGLYPMSESLSVRPVLGFGPAKLLSAATTSDVGKVVCADGHLRDAKTAVPAGGTAVGILGKVTETGHGLILALQDAPAQTWYTINGWTSTTDFAGTTLKVLPDAAAHGSLTSYTTLGTTAVSDWAVAQKSDYEAIFTNLGSTNSDSNGTTYDDNVNAYITTGVGGTALSSNYRYWSATVLNNEYAWDFHSYYSWYSGYKTSSYSVRPVLGF